MAATRFMQFVLKVSKLCNLRCAYCYEYPHLDDPAAMSLDQLRAFYRNVSEYYRARDARDGGQTELRFIWHGGEPLLRPPAFYRQTMADQAEICGDTPRMNIVQTNLVLLDDERVELLRTCFDRVGVSCDVFGGLRLDAGGRDRQARVLANLSRLRREGIEFGAITVVTGANVDRIEAIYDFWAKGGVPVRLLPLFDGAFADQHARHDLTTGQVVDAWVRVLDRWLDDPHPGHPTPIGEHVLALLRHYSDDPKVYFRKRDWAPTVLVDTDGSTYGYGDPYGDPAWAYGNAFAQPFGELLSSPAFERSAAATEQRMARSCLSCPYFGGCDGYPIAEDQSNCRERDADGVNLCVLEKRFLAAADERLRARGIIVGDRVVVDHATAVRLGMRVGSGARTTSDVDSGPARTTRPPVGGAPAEESTSA